MNNWVGKIALVTDAADWDGPEISKLLVENGITVVGTGHRMDNLKKLSKDLENKDGKFFPYEFDMFYNNQKKISDLFDWIKENVGPIQIVIGHIGHCGEFFLSEARLEYNCKALHIITILKKSVEELTISNLPGCIIPLCILSPYFYGEMCDAHVELETFVNNLKTEVTASQKNFSVSIIGEIDSESVSEEDEDADQYEEMKQKHIKSEIINTLFHS